MVNLELENHQLLKILLLKIQIQNLFLLMMVFLEVFHKVL